MDRANGTFVRHNYDSAHPEKLSRPAQKNSRPHGADHITFIIEDAAGAIWIGTLGNGINRYDPNTKKVTYYPNFKDPVSGMLLEVPWWACNSRDGILWIGYFRGLYRIDPLRKNIPYFTTGLTVNRIYEDKLGVLWYGTDEGLVRKDRNTGVEKRYVHDPNNPFSINNNRIGAIYQDHQGELWVGTQKGLNRFDRKTGTFLRNVFNQGEIDSILSNNSIHAIYEDRQGSLWFGGSVLIRFNRQTNLFTHYRHNPKDTNSLSISSVSNIYEDRAGNLWIGTGTGGLNRFFPRSGKFRHFLYGANIHSLWHDSEGILWVGTSTGLYRSNSDLNSFSRFTGPNGEFAGNIIVNGVLEDDKRNLWVNASVGICRLNSKRSEVEIFSRYEDQAFYNGTGSYKGKNGELFFGGGSGYFTFFPEQMTRNTKAPEIVINDFRIANQPVVPGIESPLKQPLSQTKEIYLNYNQNVFSFDFAGIHYSNPEQNRHLFMLEGLDNTWRKAGEEKTAYYYNIPTGHYVFRVKAANSDGVWGEKAIAVIINPPWWHAWWAYAIYALLIAGSIWAIIHYRSRYLRREIEQRKKEKQLAELRHQKSELEMQALRAQMNPHFIFNSLNSINHFILNNEAENASDYLTKFSRLIRMVLQNSSKKNIPLCDELETLHLYIDLERVRFKNHFDCTIQSDKSVDTESIMVPPLLLQPFVENAIWHGLMHKEERGKLNITISQKDEMLCCTITDNGIGREKAAAIKTKSTVYKKSMGMQITASRLQILNDENKDQVLLQITDVMCEANEVCGTQVLIKIPISISES